MLIFTCTKICSIATEVFQIPKYKQSQAGADTGNDMIQPETRSNIHWIRRHRGVRLWGFAFLAIFWILIFFYSQWEVIWAHVKYFKSERNSFNRLFPFWWRQRGDHRKEQCFHLQSSNQTWLLQRVLDYLLKSLHLPSMAGGVLWEAEPNSREGGATRGWSWLKNREQGSVRGEKMIMLSFFL